MSAPHADAPMIEVAMSAHDWPKALALVTYGAFLEGRAGHFPADAWAAVERLVHEAAHLGGTFGYSGAMLPEAEARAFATLLDRLCRIGAGYAPVPAVYCWDDPAWDPDDHDTPFWEWDGDRAFPIDVSTTSDDSPWPILWRRWACSPTCPETCGGPRTPEHWNEGGEHWEALVPVSDEDLAAWERAQG